MPIQSTMDARLRTAKQATRDIEKWLRKRSEKPDDVRNVEDDPQYQAVDIDLLWMFKGKEYKIEIKGDTYDTTGNFFLETYSNKEKGTPGCFMYTAADVIFYYFINTKTLYTLPMPETRIWFLEHIDDFPERPTQTIIGNGKFYTTVGRLVKITEIRKAIPKIRMHKLVV